MMENLADLPAAHSMDTEWFAVDADGRVGVFQSCEAGAMPVAGESVGEGFEDLLLKIVGAQPGGVLPVDLAAIVGDAPEGKAGLDDDSRAYRVGDGVISIMQRPPEPPPNFFQRLIRGLFGSPAQGAQEELVFGALFEIRSAAELDETARALKAAGATGIVPLLLRDAAAIYCGDVPLMEMDRLKLSGISPRWWKVELSPGAFGFYDYRHGEEFENWIAGPYQREPPPARPLSIEELPGKLRSLFAKVRFDSIRFAETEALQPIEWTECAMYDCGAWIDAAQTRIRCLPGMERQYREYYESLRESAEQNGWQIDAPAGKKK